MSVPTTDVVSSRGYHARLGDLLLRLAVAPDRPVQIQLAELQPPRFQTEANPEDVISSFGDIHSQSDFTGGEGLLNRFRRDGDERDATRFFDSKGVDVSPTDVGVPQQVRLHRDAEQVDAITGVVHLATAERVLWATAGQTLRKTADILATTPSFADDDPHNAETATDVEDVTALGGIPYAALGANGIHRDDGGWAHWSDLEAVRVWDALDRVIASDGDGLYEADSGTNSTLLYTLPDGETWTDVTDAAGTILAGATSGFVYSFSVDDAGALQVVGQTRFRGEQVRALAARSTLVWVVTQAGTELRVWQTQVEQGLLSGLQLLREWSNGGAGAAIASRDRAFVGVDEGGTPYLWRIELSTGGLFRGFQLSGGQVNAVRVVEGNVLAGVEDGGVWRQIDERVESGYLIGPMSDFFRAEDKSWVAGWADVETGGGSVELWFTVNRDAMFDPDHASWTRLRTYLDDSSGGQEVALGDVVARSLAGMVKLQRDGGETPRVRSFSFRSYPTGGDVIVSLPVDVGDQLERPGRRRLHNPGWGRRIYDELVRREAKAAVCEVFRTGDLIRGIVESVETPIPAITPRGTVTQVSHVRVRGRRLNVQTRDIGSGGYLGGGPIGSFTLGGTKG